MFCVHCGAQIPDSANFCVGCGVPVAPAAPALTASVTPPVPAPPAPRPEPPRPTPPPPPPLHAAPVASTATAKCVWCGADIVGAESSCPRCGAALRVDQIVTESGWRELPGRKDMAKLQFGNSQCQIEGVYVPVADFGLAPGDGVYFTHHVILWKDPQVNITTMSMAGAWKRMFAGMPVIMTQAHGPGHIAFSRDEPGELIPVPLQPGQEIDVREHLFLAATHSVQYDWFQTNIWFSAQNGNETETHYPLGMFMDRFVAPQAPGLLMLHAAGNVFVRDLAPGQTILIKPTALVFKDPSVQMHLHFERLGSSPLGGLLGGLGTGGLGNLGIPDLGNLGIPGLGGRGININIGGRGFGGSSFGWGNRYIWLRLVGPGRVGVQSVFDRIEGASRNITNFSYATETVW